MLPIDAGVILKSVPSTSKFSSDRPLTNRANWVVVQARSRASQFSGGEESATWEGLIDQGSQIRVGLELTGLGSAGFVGANIKGVDQVHRDLLGDIYKVTALLQQRYRNECSFWHTYFRGARSQGGDSASDPKSDVAGRTLRRGTHPRRGTITTAVRLMAQVRTALHQNGFGDSGPNVAIAGHKCIGGPFPDVPDHVPEAERIGFVAAHGTSRSPVCFRIAIRELTNEDVHSWNPVGLAIVAPRPPRRAATPSRELPLRLARQSSRAPRCVGNSVVVADVYNGVVGPAFDSPRRSFRRSPRCGKHLPPPLRSDHAAGLHEIIRQEACEHERPFESLRVRDVSGCIDKRRELVIRDACR